MKKKKKMDFSKWMEDTSTKLIDVYQLGAINIYYKKAPKELAERSKGLIFSVRYNHRYKTATIYYYDLAEQFFTDGEMSILTGSLMHEFTHIVIEQLSSAAEKRYITEEEVTDIIDNTTEHLTIIIKDLLGKTQESIIK